MMTVIREGKTLVPKYIRLYAMLWLWTMHPRVNIDSRFDILSTPDSNSKLLNPVSDYKILNTLISLSSSTKRVKIGNSMYIWTL